MSEALGRDCLDGFSSCLLFNQTLMSAYQKMVLGAIGSLCPLTNVGRLTKSSVFPINWPVLFGLWRMDGWIWLLGAQTVTGVGVTCPRFTGWKMTKNLEPRPRPARLHDQCNSAMHRTPPFLTFHTLPPLPPKSSPSRILLTRFPGSVPKCLAGDYRMLSQPGQCQQSIQISWVWKLAD